MSSVICKQCGDEMQRSSKAETNMALQLLGVVVFLIGLAISFSGIGVIIGVPLMLAALFMGYKKKKVMKCGGCGYFFEVA